jgi:hypothetical protein
MSLHCWKNEGDRMNEFQDLQTHRKRRSEETGRSGRIRSRSTSGSLDQTRWYMRGDMGEEGSIESKQFGAELRTRDLLSQSLSRRATLCREGAERRWICGDGEEEARRRRPTAFAMERSSR